MPNPDVSFIFPYRWLNKDRQYLVDNLKKQIKKGESKVIFHERLQKVNKAYSAVLKCHAWQPPKIGKKDFQEALKESLPNLDCVGFETFFFQNNNKLPIMELELYF